MKYDKLKLLHIAARIAQRDFALSEEYQFVHVPRGTRQTRLDSGETVDLVRYTDGAGSVIDLGVSHDGSVVVVAV